MMYHLAKIVAGGECIFCHMWAQNKFLLLRAVHCWKLDFLSWHWLRPREWRLHPQSTSLIRLVLASSEQLSVLFDSLCHIQRLFV